MFDEAPVLLILGFMFLIGMAADLIGRHSAVPRVTPAITRRALMVAKKGNSEIVS